MSHSRHNRILVTEVTSDKTRPAKSILHEVRLQIDNTKIAINAAVYRLLPDPRHRIRNRQCYYPSDTSKTTLIV